MSRSSYVYLEYRGGNLFGRGMYIYVPEVPYCLGVIVHLIGTYACVHLMYLGDTVYLQGTGSVYLYPRRGGMTTYVHRV